MPLDANVNNVTIFLNAKPQGLRRLLLPMAAIDHKTLGACVHPLSAHDLIADGEYADIDMNKPARTQFVVTDLDQIMATFKGLHAFSHLMMHDTGI